MTRATRAPTLTRTLLHTRLLTPSSPAALFRLVHEARRGGQNPFTLLAVTAARWPNRVAVIDDDGTFSYRDLRSRTESLAHELHHHGVGPGRAVGILCRNGHVFIEAMFATTLVGADVVPLNTDFRATALTAVVSAHRISTIICEQESAEQARAAGEAITVIDPATVHTDARRPRPAVAAPGRVIILTAGTTGTPKGVPRTSHIGSTLGLVVTLLDRTRLRTGARSSVAVPMFHGFGLGMLMLTFALGGTVLTHRRFDAEAAIAQASRYAADTFTAVPVMLSRILDLPETVRTQNPMPSLRAVISIGDRLDPSVAQRFMNTYGDILYNGYGASEVGICAFATPADLRQAPETVGSLVPGYRVGILDADGKPVGPHVVGRVFVGGDLTFEAYTGGGTKEVVDGMTNSGDMGYLDEAGRLFIIGRQDDMIISGGENVYPRAVENALAEHPDVADNTVVGVPDEQFGQRLAAFVVPRPNRDLDEHAIREYLKDKVSRAEQPRDIHIVTAIPRSPVGKALRRELPT
ncbi:AMP-binding protein [Mycobacterium kansasii]|uniref:Long-chain-fatty-acid--CoA ligase n=5 Tax=Mycobacterium kansasii TaxID=1768 RepID=A0A653F7J0_MYCKA|nr:AMP-binding protein [Mycobacterium kansasii]EUA00831.1 AMP-binding enzyme family protein [Mycobacterium kansasii 824]AGZ49504.1 acyl-CoA synthetase [Mycobacterium kansasii ATCC 12478]ARG58561.1 acyl-CoA synthetase [Mycobacterium kansasii]ARG64074.1 acyl-CoA synthetase [Mycobacterium kansasii]ARG71726.1 acyl-CoA synthetase [Mycobacterium kansasii]